MNHLTWNRRTELTSDEHYKGNQILARELSEKGYHRIIDEYVYIDSPQVAETMRKIPGAWQSFEGKGVDFGGGVSCISSTIATRAEVERIYCVELVEDVVSLCHPVVKKQILGEESDKVISVVGDFDQLELSDNSMNFAVSWDSMHHSMAPLRTLQEARRVLVPGGRLVIVDRGHNDSTPDNEIERMLNIIYDREFLIRTYRDPSLVLTRRDNGEHEYRYYEWEALFGAAGFELISSAIIKTDSPENRRFRNDHGLPEIIVDYELGGFGHRKVAFVLVAEHQEPVQVIRR